MQEELVEFETAKLAKEKIFDEEVNDFFILDENGNGQEVVKDSGCYLWQSFLNKAKFNSSKKYVSRPTQSLLQKWLREMCNIDVFVYKGKSGYYVQSYQRDLNTENCDFKTYEEALELGLQEALKLIK